MRPETYKFARDLNPKARRNGDNIYTRCPKCHGENSSCKYGGLIVWEQDENIHFRCQSCGRSGVTVQAVVV